MKLFLSRPRPVFHPFLTIMTSKYGVISITVFISVFKVVYAATNGTNQTDIPLPPALPQFPDPYIGNCLVDLVREVDETRRVNSTNRSNNKSSCISNGTVEVDNSTQNFTEMLEFLHEWNITRQQVKVGMYNPCPTTMIMMPTTTTTLTTALTQAPTKEKMTTVTTSRALPSTSSPPPTIKISTAKSVSEKPSSPKPADTTEDPPTTSSQKLTTVTTRKTVDIKGSGESKPSSKTLNVGIIVGACSAVLVTVGLIILGVICYKRKTRTKVFSNSKQPDKDPRESYCINGSEFTATEVEQPPTRPPLDSQSSTVGLIPYHTNQTAPPGGYGYEHSTHTIHEDSIGTYSKLSQSSSNGSADKLHRHTQAYDNPVFDETDETPLPTEPTLTTITSSDKAVRNNASQDSNANSLGHTGDGDGLQPHLGNESRII